MITLVNSEQILETPRLILEPLMPSHASLIYEQLLDDKLYKFIPNNPPESLSYLEERFTFLSSRLSPNQEEAWLNWVVKLKEGGKYVGRLESSVNKNRTASIAYIIFSDFWKKGYAKEGCKRILESLITDYEVKSITSEIDTRNIASIKLIESLGFQYVSMKNNADFFKGSASDEYLYELRV